MVESLDMYEILLSGDQEAKEQDQQDALEAAILMGIQQRNFMEPRYTSHQALVEKGTKIGEVLTAELLKPITSYTEVRYPLLHRRDLL